MDSDGLSGGRNELEGKIGIQIWELEGSNIRVMLYFHDICLLGTIDAGMH